MCTFYFYNKFGKCEPLLIIILLSHFQMNCRKFLGLRIYAPVHLLTYTVGSVHIKPSVSLKLLKIELKLL